jgi:hypothetical protein
MDEQRARLDIVGVCSAVDRDGDFHGYPHMCADGWMSPRPISRAGETIMPHLAEPGVIQRCWQSDDGANGRLCPVVAEY